VTRDTIFALSSGLPPAAISVIRVSGPQAHDVGRTLAGDIPAPRHAAVRTLRSRASGAVLDEALLLRFEAPASATGEDVLELHCHGGRAVVSAVLAELSAFEDVREALPGEFTRRAFENGRIDLTEAEGLADLIEAETERQRKAALAVAEGGLRRQVEKWRQDLLSLSARAEAAIDYVEESDVVVDAALPADCAALAQSLEDWLARPRAEPLKDGLRVVVAGPPNAGKSSLINAIAGQDKAIVTEIPGTTRDLIEVPLALAGVPFLFIDTAGLRSTEDRVERIGVERALRQIERADILLWLGETAEAPSHDRLMRLHAKTDLPGRGEAPEGSLPVSSTTGLGIDGLIEHVIVAAQGILPAEDAIALNRRQADALSDAWNALQAIDSECDIVLTAENLRSARTAFDRLTGRAGVDDMLDALFGRFCLGK